MERFLLLIALCAVSSASVINLNEICSGILYYALPHPSNSNQYIGCVRGKGTIMGCLEADEVFDEFSVACVKENQPRPPHDVLCENITIGWFPHEEDCSKYVVCQDGRPNIRSCPDNNIFTERLPGCVPGNPQTCEYEGVWATTTARPTEPPTQPPTAPPTAPPTQPPTTEATTLRTTTEMTTTRTTNPPPTTRDPSDVNIQFNCPIDGFGNVPNPSDCTRYFECIQGVRNNRRCPPGLIFDVIRSDCGTPETSLCAENIRCL